MSIQTGLSFKEFIGKLVGEITEADAEMQLVQRDGWMQFNEGYPLLEGLDRFANLGITEVKLSFCVEPARPGLWSRLQRAVQHIFGKALPVASEASLIGAPGKTSTKGFEVTVTISRDHNSRLRVDSEPELMQDVSVSNLLP